MTKKPNTSYAITNRGVVRQLNEDAHVEINSHNLWVVADGMGGHEAGDFASQLVVDEIKSSVLNLPHEQVSSAHVIAAIESANSKLHSYSQQCLDGKTAGSTVVALLINDAHFSIIWAGDSRAYLLRNNQLKQVSSDHSQVNELVAEGVISHEQAQTHPLSNVITRAVGVAKEIEVDVYQDKIEAGDIFLLCSDGLTGELSDQDICLALDTKNIIDSGMALMHSALVRGAKDNVTCVLVKHSDYNPEYFSHSDNDERTVPLFALKQS